MATDTATRIKEIRQERGLSQEAAARLAGISWATWQRTESGATSPDIETLKKIAKALGVEPGSLV